MRRGIATAPCWGRGGTSRPRPFGAGERRSAWIGRLIRASGALGWTERGAPTTLSSPTRSTAGDWRYDPPRWTDAWWNRTCNAWRVTGTEAPNDGRCTRGVSGGEPRRANGKTWPRFGRWRRARGRIDSTRASAPGLPNSARGDSSAPPPRSDANAGGGSSPRSP